MLYMFKVYTLVAVFVFGFAGIVMMTLAVWNEAKKYALARRATRRVSPAASREPLANSRTNSRPHDVGSFHAA